MTRHEFTCDTCGEAHRYPISAAICCDPIQDADDNPDIIRGED